MFYDSASALSTNLSYMHVIKESYESILRRASLAAERHQILTMDDSKLSTLTQRNRRKVAAASGAYLTAEPDEAADLGNLNRYLLEKSN